MTTTPPAAISSGCSDDDGPAQNADSTGFRVLSAWPGRSFISVPDRHRRLISGVDPAAYAGRFATSVDFASRD